MTYNCFTLYLSFRSELDNDGANFPISCPSKTTPSSSNHRNTVNTEMNWRESWVEDGGGDREGRMERRGKEVDAIYVNGNVQNDTDKQATTAAAVVERFSDLRIVEDSEDEVAGELMGTEVGVPSAWRLVNNSNRSNSKNNNISSKEFFVNNNRGPDLFQHKIKGNTLSFFQKTICKSVYLSIPLSIHLSDSTFFFLQSQNNYSCPCLPFDILTNKQKQLKYSSIELRCNGSCWHK